MFGCAWLCLAVFGCAWLCLAVFGCVWLCLIVCCCVWLCLVVFGRVFLFQEFHKTDVMSKNGKWLIATLRRRLLDAESKATLLDQILRRQKRYGTSLNPENSRRKSLFLVGKLRYKNLELNKLVDNLRQQLKKRQDLSEQWLQQQQQQHTNEPNQQHTIKHNQAQPNTTHNT